MQTTSIIYTPADWSLNNQKWFDLSEQHRKEFQRIKEEAKSVSQEKAVLTQINQNEVTKELGSRAKDIFIWKKELEKTIEKITSETHKLIGQKKRLENALAVSDTPLMLGTECLDLRKQRLATDLVEDNVQLALWAEIDVVKNVKMQLKKHIDDAENQIRKNMTAKEELERDWSDKVEAYNIDTSSGHLQNISIGGIQFQEESSTLPERFSTPDVWKEHTVGNIDKATREMYESSSLRTAIDQLLQDTSQNMRNQADNVQKALTRRCTEVEECRYRLSQHSQMVGKEIAQAERTIHNLKRAILEKEAPLKVAQTRLHHRWQRPNVELCNDLPHNSLIKEVREITTTIETLKHHLKRAEDGLQNLQETKKGLEKEIAIKENSLKIDRERCAAVRMCYPPINKLLGY
ncbi:tektin-4-like [Tachypleus tridentatus]|uniref:tektin-4-like n=1 Tax=Tachypleus tridentatus TaxID=6853 RepID=UPI003FD57AFB